MNRVIGNEADYKEALSRIESLMDRNPSMGTSASEELECLILLVRRYESPRYHFPAPDPVEAVKFRMEQQNIRFET